MFDRLMDWMMRHETVTVIIVSVLASLIANAIMTAIG